MTFLSHIEKGSILRRVGESDSTLNVKALVAQIKQDLHPGQLAFVEDETTDILGLSAGYGAGKTRALAAKSCLLAIANQGFLGCVLEPTGPLIRDIWIMISSLF